MSEHRSPQLDLTFDVLPGAVVSDVLRREILSLCARAYEEDLATYLGRLTAPTHVIARAGGQVVGHALWVTRWLQQAGGPLMRTAYVELVATEPAFQRRGVASTVMRRLAECVRGYDLAALCPAEAAVGLYAGLGWVPWRGPLSIRDGQELVPTPDERIMVLSLPGTPALDLDAPLSAEWRPGELW